MNIKIVQANETATMVEVKGTKCCMAVWVRARLHRIRAFGLWHLGLGLRVRANVIFG